MKNMQLLKLLYDNNQLYSIFNIYINILQTIVLNILFIYHKQLYIKTHTNKLKIKIYIIYCMLF